MYRVSLTIFSQIFINSSLIWVLITSEIFGSEMFWKFQYKINFVRVQFQSFARIIYMTTYEVYVYVVKKTLQYLKKPLTKKNISQDIVKAAN